jgi:hypothetical protein
MLGSALLMVGCANQESTGGQSAQNDQKALEIQLEELEAKYEQLQVKYREIEEEKKELENRIAAIEDEEGSSDKYQATEQVKHETIENYPISMLNQRTFDLKGNGEEQSIELYANVEKIEGEEGYAWDDGQRWLLVVKDGEKTYPLFDDRIQLGRLTYWIFTTEETPTLVLLYSATASFHLQTFTYDAEEDTFIRSTIYNPSMINYWGSSSQPF